MSAKLDDGVEAHLRIGRNSAGRVVVKGLFVEAPEITTDTLRDLRPARLLASVRSLRPGPGSGVTVVTGDALLELYADGDALLELYADGDDRQTTLGELRSRATAGQVRAPRRHALGRPDGGDVDDFYGRVAVAYRSAAAESSRPAVILASENDVPVETVRRWIKEARRRGHLAAGTKGRAG